MRLKHNQIHRIQVWNIYGPYMDPVRMSLLSLREFLMHFVKAEREKERERERAKNSIPHDSVYLPCTFIVENNQP